MTHVFEGLSKGDTIRIIAPGWIGDRKTLLKSVRRLKSLGWSSLYHKSFLDKKHPITHQTDAFKLRDLSQALLGDEKMIWCFRGGYGSSHLLPGLMKLRKPTDPKILLGYSDITVLHIFLQQHWDWPSFHGPLLDRFGEGRMFPRDEKNLLKLLNGELDQIYFKGLKPLNMSAKRNSRIHGRMAGGNLAVFNSLGGTPWEFRKPGRIFFFEEVGERGYSIDRLLFQLKNSGQLGTAKAIIFGNLFGGDEKDGKNFAWRAVEDFAQQMPIPIFGGLNAGHGPSQPVIPFNTRTILETGTSGTLTIDTRIQRARPDL